MAVLSVAMLLFLIMDPFGNMVVVNTLLADMPVRTRQHVIVREAVIATSILLVAVFLGGSVLEFLKLEPHALRLTGGIVLFLIALGMLFPSRRISEETPVETPLVVPIAMPLIAGPSAISMVVLLAEKHAPTMVATAVVGASLVTAVLLAMSSTIVAKLGRRGTIALERLMGMLLIMLSVQMFLNGIDTYLDSRG